MNHLKELYLKENRLVNFPLKENILFYFFPYLFLFNADWRITGFFITVMLAIVLIHKIEFTNIILFNGFHWLGLLIWGALLIFKSITFQVGLSYFLGTIFFPFLLFQLINNYKPAETTLKKIFNHFFVVGAILGLYSTYIFVESGFNLTLRIPSLWQDFNIMSTFLMVLLIFNLNFLVEEKTWGSKIFYLITLIFTLQGILLSQTRGVWIGTLLACVIFILKRPKVFIPALVFFSILFIFFSAIFIDRFLSVKNFQYDWSTLGRLQAWYASIILIKQNILLGYGFDSFILLRDSVFDFYIVKVLHSHNTYLRSLLEMGLIGFLLYYLFLIKSLIFSFYLRNKLKSFIKYLDSIQMSFLSLLVCFMFEPYFSLYGGSCIMIWLLISLSYFLKNHYAQIKQAV